MRTMPSCSATPAVLNEWFAAFGLGDTTAAAAKDDDGKGDDGDNQTADLSDDNMLYYNYLTERRQQLVDEASSDNGNSSSCCSSSVACDHGQCRMVYGVCCDCCRCLKHCKCGDLNVLPPTCDTPDCSERVCPQCMRCNHHCLCRCSTVVRDGAVVRRGVYRPRGGLNAGASSTGRVAPPPFTEEPAVGGHEAANGVWRDCYDPYDDDGGDVDEFTDWVGSKARVVTCDGTVTTMATAKTDATLRRNKTNFEVVYDEKYNHPSKTTTAARLGMLNCLKQQRHHEQQPQRRRNMGGKSRQFDTRPRAAAALAEF